MLLSSYLCCKGIHYLGQLHDNSLLRVALDQITEGQLQFTRLEEHFDTLILGQDDTRRWSTFLSLSFFLKIS